MEEKCLHHSADYSSFLVVKLIGVIILAVMIAGCRRDAPEEGSAVDSVAVEKLVKEAAIEQATLPPVVSSYPVLSDFMEIFLTSEAESDPFSESVAPVNLVDRLTHALRATRRVVSPEIEGVTDGDDLCYDVRGLLEQHGIAFAENDWALFNVTRSKVIIFTSQSSQDLLEAFFAYPDEGCRPRMGSVEVVEVSLPRSKKFAPVSSEEIYARKGMKVEASGGVWLRSGESAVSSSSPVEGEDGVANALEVELTLGDQAEVVDVGFHYQRAAVKVSSSLSMRSGQPQWLKLFTDPDSERDHYLLIQAKVTKP